MQVLKFGGTSVADAASICQVIGIIKHAISQDKTIVVCSAITGATDILVKVGQKASCGDRSYLTDIDRLQKRHLDIIHDLGLDNTDIRPFCSDSFDQLRSIANCVYLLKELTPHSCNTILSFGELLSTRILAARLKTLGILNRWIDSREVIKTEFRNSQNFVLREESYRLIQEKLASAHSKLYVFPGFIATDMDGHATTLGRGGSDYTASLLAVAADARILEIWTDVSGMKTADPRIVPDAKTIQHILYKEALELSHFGAKVIFPTAIQPLVSKAIPIYIKNTFDPEGEGTLIEANPPEDNNKIKGISSSDEIALISMEGSGMVGVPGYSSRLFAALASNDINIILITQASSVHTMCIAIDEKDAQLAKEVADEAFAYEISLGKVDPLKVEVGFSIISLVGDEMKNQPSASGRMFRALGREGINIRAIAQGSSEKNVSAVIKTSDIKLGVRTIHREFFSDSIREIKIFLVGVGVVGTSLLEIIEKNREQLLKSGGKDISVCGVANSTRFLIDKNGLDLKNIKEELLSRGDGQGDFIEEIIRLKMSDAVFVDCSSSVDLPLRYNELLFNRIPVVTSNKIAGSSNMEFYKSLKELCLEKGCNFLYETSVGASLPIISTFQQLVNSGDTIHKIEGILSGTLNYLFSQYDSTVPFVDIVKAAKAAGYTETDPRIDLSGVDVLRKSTILAREIGKFVEIEDIRLHKILEDEVFEGSLDDFYRKLGENEAYFSKMYHDAAREGKKVRFISTIDGDGVTVGLKAIDAEHPFYNVNGTNNAVIINTGYYPLSIKIEGAGAGGKQTALGVLNDIIKSLQ